MSRPVNISKKANSQSNVTQANTLKFRKRVVGKAIKALYQYFSKDVRLVDDLIWLETMLRWFFYRGTGSPAASLNYVQTCHRRILSVIKKDEAPRLRKKWLTSKGKPTSSLNRTLRRMTYLGRDFGPRKKDPESHALRVCFERFQPASTEDGTYLDNFWKLTPVAKDVLKREFKDDPQLVAYLTGEIVRYQNARKKREQAKAQPKKEESKGLEQPPPNVEEDSKKISSSGNHFSVPTPKGYSLPLEDSGREEVCAASDSSLQPSPTENETKSKILPDDKPNTISPFQRRTAVPDNAALLSEQHKLDNATPQFENTDPQLQTSNAPLLEKTTTPNFMPTIKPNRTPQEFEQTLKEELKTALQRIEINSTGLHETLVTRLKNIERERIYAKYRERRIYSRRTELTKPNSKSEMQQLSARTTSSDEGPIVVVGAENAPD